MRGWPPRASLGVLVALPLLAGLLGTVLPAFPGGTLDAWRALLAAPGLERELALTLRIGVLATIASLASAVGLAVLARRAAVLAVLLALAAPLLAVPHAAIASGLAFLIAPSGWMARLASPWLSGWSTPPDVAVVHDPGGYAMAAGLWLKETPFLLLTILAALPQAQAAASMRAAATLGHGVWRAWMLVLLPRVWPQIRLPVMAVLVFSLSSVDVARVLGPGTPPPFAVQLLRWFTDPDIGRWPVACAGALLLAALCGACLLALSLAEILAASCGRMLLARGPGRAPGRVDPWGDGAALVLGGALGLAAIGAAAATLLWAGAGAGAGAGAWRFPAAWPEGWSAQLLGFRLGALGEDGAATCAIAAAATALSLVAAIAVLHGGRKLPAWVFAPLLIPAPSLLWGQQVLLTRAGLDGTYAAVIWSHVQFVLPYVLLVLAEPFRALDPRHARAAQGLGAGRLRVLCRVTLPLLARPLQAAAAIGFSVSVGLYLPSVFAGDGRVETLAMATVSLASGPDRRLAAAAALAQAALPCAAFLLALLLPAWRARGRRGVAIAVAR